MGAIQAGAINLIIENEDIDDVTEFIKKCSVYYSALLSARQGD